MRLFLKYDSKCRIYKNRDIMIRLNRTTEYGLMALRHMSRKQSKKPTEFTSAREIADSYGLPFEITAKTLQRLVQTGLIQAAYGAKGGYTLLCSLDKVSLAEFLQLMEGPQAIVACAEGETSHVNTCEYETRCELKQLMGRLNARIFQFLSGIPLAEFAEDPVEIVKLSPSFIRRIES